MKTYTIDEMKRAFECGRNFQLTGENNFQELIEALSPALPIHSVVRGGDFETRSVPCAAVNHIGQIIHFTQNTPTKPLPAEGSAKTVSAWPKACQANSASRCDYPNCGCPEMRTGA